MGIKVRELRPGKWYIVVNGKGITKHVGGSKPEAEDYARELRGELKLQAIRTGRFEGVAEPGSYGRSVRGQVGSGSRQDCPEKVNHQLLSLAPKKPHPFGV